MPWGGYLSTEDLGHSEGVFVRQKNEPCHNNNNNNTYYIIINLFVITTAPIFPKRPPMVILFLTFSHGAEKRLYSEPTIHGPELSDNPEHQMIQFRELISGIASIRQEGKTN